MSSGVSRVITGAVTGTGALLEVRTVGFRPKRVELYNQNTNVKGAWQASMGDGEMMKEVAAGTKSFVTSNGVTPLSDGFSIGTDAINGSGNTLHFVAYE